VDKVRLGIIGTGYIGNVHAGIYANDPRVEVSALYDIIPERAEATSRRVGGRVCGSRHELLDRCDAVLVCTPNRTHTEIALDAIAADRHVFCEKPFSVGIADAKRLLEAAEGSHRTFQVGHSRRFAPVYRKLKELLSDDEPHSAHIKMNRGELRNPTWTGDAGVTGGFLYETTIHLFDMLRFQFGEVDEIVAYGSQHQYPEPDEFSIIFRLKSGFHCTFASSSDASWHFPFERVEVFCHHRTVMAEEMERVLDSHLDADAVRTYSFHTCDEYERRGFIPEDKAFIDSVMTQEPPAVTALDGYRSVEIVESVYTAISTGERIRI
jgi:myo-inositol 2-dehydrogenase / D-chiro-inositol 1-dehydrogenase